MRCCLVRLVELQQGFSQGLRRLDAALERLHALVPVEVGVERLGGEARVNVQLGVSEAEPVGILQDLAVLREGPSLPGGGGLPF